MKIKNYVPAFLLALAINSGCDNNKGKDSNTGAWQEASSNGYTYKYVEGDPLKARFYTLKNGFTAIISSNERQPRIRALIGVRAGSNNDPREHTGLAHYLEHLLFKGTTKYGTIDSAAEKPYLDEITALYEQYNRTIDTDQRRVIYKKIDSVSGIAAKYAIANEYDRMTSEMGSENTNAHTSFDETVYEETIPSNALDKYLILQAERFRAPVFRLFHTELEAVYEEKNRNLDNDFGNVYDSLLYGLFPQSNYGQQTILGTVEHLKNPSLVAIRNFYNKYYQPGNMSLVLAGDVDPDSAIVKIDKAFGGWVSTDTSTEVITQENDLTNTVVKELKGPDAAAVVMGFRLPGAKDEHALAVSNMLQLLLSNGKAGLMDVNLNNQQKVLASSCSFMPMKDYSILLLEGKPQEGQSLEQVKEHIDKQLELLKQGAFDDTLMKAVVTNYKLQQLKSKQYNEIRAVELMNAFIRHKGFRWNDDVELIKRMSALSKQDIVDFARKSLSKNCVVVFKRNGERRGIAKIQKPLITPVTINRDVSSVFASSLRSMTGKELSPRWVDFDKDINKSSVSGAEVLHVLNKDDQLFKLSYSIPVGSWNDKRLPLAVNYLDFLGDDKYSSEEMQKKFYQLGFDYNISVKEEETIVTLSGLHEYYNEGVALFEHFIRNCRIDDTALMNFKSRLHKMRQDAKLDKSQLSEGLLNYAIYGPRNPFNYQLTNDELNSLNSKDMVELLHQLFNYKHTVIYYGPYEKDEFNKSLSSVHQISSQFKEPSTPARFPVDSLKERQVLFTPYDMVQAEVNWSANSIPFDSSIVPTVTLFNQYFGAGMGSLVFQTIRESRALAYSTYAYFQLPVKKEEHFKTVAYVGTQADKMHEAILTMDDLLTNLPKAEGMLVAAKESVRQFIINDRILGDDIAFSYLSARKLGLHSDIRKLVYAKINELQFEDLQAFYQKIIAGKKYSYNIVGSPALLKQAEFLKPAKFIQLNAKEIFGY